MLPLCFANAPLSGRQVLCINGSVCNASLLDRGRRSIVCAPIITALLRRIYATFRDDLQQQKYATTQRLPISPKARLRFAPVTPGCC